MYSPMLPNFGGKVNSAMAKEGIKPSNGNIATRRPIITYSGIMGYVDPMIMEYDDDTHMESHSCR